jgi:hypothetical protein
VALVLRHVIGRIRARWPAVEIVVRGDSHYGRPEAMIWCERNRIGYIFGLAGNPVLLHGYERARELWTRIWGEEVIAIADDSSGEYKVNPATGKT